MQTVYPAPMTRSYFAASILALLPAFAAISLASPGVQAQGFSRGNDQNEARENMLDRKVMPFSIIKRRTESAMENEASYVGVAPSPREGIYRMQFLRKDGRVIWVDVDGKTGDIVGRTK
ncbi:MAG TPA: hypothetical protein VGE65_07810 [Sphingobium sp.]